MSSMPDLWSPDALVPRERAPSRYYAVVPRSRIPPKPTMKRRIGPAPKPLPPVLVSPFGMEFTIINPADKSMADIAAAVGIKHGWTVAAMRGESRRHSLVVARHEAWARIFAELHFTLCRIGKFFNKDHTTVLNGIRKHEQRRAKEGRGE